MCRWPIFAMQRLQMGHSIEFISLHPGGWSLTSRVLRDPSVTLHTPLFLNCNVTMSTDSFFSEPTFSILDGRLPRSEGVYAVVVTPKWDQTSTPLVVYIGSSKDLYHRFRVGGTRGHVYRRLKTLLKGYSVDLHYKEVKDHLKVEISMIKKYRPRFNKTYK